MPINEESAVNIVQFTDGREMRWFQPLKDLPVAPSDDRTDLTNRKISVHRWRWARIGHWRWNTNIRYRPTDKRNNWKLPTYIQLSLPQPNKQEPYKYLATLQIKTNHKIEIQIKSILHLHSEILSDVFLLLSSYPDAQQRFNLIRQP